MIQWIEGCLTHYMKGTLFLTRIQAILIPSVDKSPYCRVRGSSVSTAPFQVSYPGHPLPSAAWHPAGRYDAARRLQPSAAEPGSPLSQVMVGKYEML